MIRKLAFIPPSFVVDKYGLMPQRLGPLTPDVPLGFVEAVFVSTLRVNGLEVVKSHHWLNPQARNPEWHTDGFDSAMAVLSDDPTAGTMYDDPDLPRGETWTLYFVPKEIQHRGSGSEHARILLCFEVSR